MQRIWLQKLGMSEYAERFVENRVDLSVLPDLTDRPWSRARRLRQRPRPVKSPRYQNLSHDGGHCGGHESGIGQGR
jgi:hypothetical protein